jgi:membrane-associated phospholipid phosphatase
MHRSPLQALITAAACAAGALLVWIATFHVLLAARMDEATLRGFMGLRGPRTERLAEITSSLADPRPFAALTVALVCLALARGRPRHALTVAIVLAGANVTTQLLKPALAHPRLETLTLPNGIEVASWPSGHTTAAMSLALCLVLVSPSRLRPLAATVGGVFAVAVVYGILLLGWHYPSDILGGFLVATGWTFLGLAALRAADRRWPEGRGRETAMRVADALRPTVAAAAMLAALAGAVALARLDTTLDYARDNTTFFAGAAVIGASALALAAGLAAALRR